ncbi:Protein of unknown function [Algoriella xinjiangensis]|uniref:DUF2971 domain-containing protein n=1 Tax=Algoriella xinjiangensis TaxID=684065 RepID=A0A1I4V9C6_9FLAO|nr:DUF2971 domain-containing protein [Algoriella xinjiangensis]SFM97788.1 Protein of unknown function [Algoriella xinjiangensis]VDH17053.1 Protein of uncharacterised function (DUF2971) [Algoriella xinjiangensis]
MRTKEHLINFLLETEIPDDLESKEESKIVSKIFKYCLDITPDNLYRYRTCNERNFQTLLEDKFLLTKPTLFNDPYDSLLYINRDKIISDLTKNQEDDIVEKLQNDAQFKEEQTQLLGKDFVEKYANLEPFKSSTEKEIFKTAAEKIYTKFVDQLIDESLKSMRQSSLVACLSEDFESILMWSHYADNHRGFVLNYDFKSRYSIKTKIPGVIATEFADKKLFPVRYSDERFDATYYVEFHFIDNYFRSMGLKLNKPFFDKLFYYKILLFKSTNWAYEKEWRIISQTNLNYNDEKPNVNFITDIKPKEILLGSKISNEDRYKLLKISEQKEIPIYQMNLEPFEKEYKLTKTSI